MKKINKRQSTGQAGEYFVGAIIASELEFIYRIQPIADIGIDGEIEIINDDGSSTAKIVKVQVKSSTFKQFPHVIYVDSKDYEYWELLNVPVIVCLAEIDKREVYWKHANDGIKNNGSYKYNFSEEDKLTKDSKGRIKSIAKKSSINLFDGLWQIVLTKLKAINDDLPHPLDPMAIYNRGEIFDKADEATELYKAVKTLANYFNNLSELASDGAVTEAQQLYSEIARKKNISGRNYAS